MRVTRLLRFLSTIFVLVLLAAACSSGGGDGGDADGDAGDGGGGEEAAGDGVAGVAGACPDQGPASIGAAFPVPIDLFATYEDVVTAELEAAGHEVQTVTGPLPPEPTGQRFDVESMIDQGVDVLIIAPINPSAMQPVLERARDEGIPIVGIDINPDLLDEYATNITGTNFTAGEDAATYMAELIGEGGTVTIMNGPEFAGRPLIERAEGFAAGAEAAGLEVLDTEIDTAISPESAEQIAVGWRAQFPDLDGVLVFGDPSGIGVQAATDDSWDPVIMSINGEVAAVDAVEAGSLAATYDLLPIIHGYLLAYAADQAWCGNELPEEIVISTVQVDESNVDAWTPLDEQRELPFSVELEESDGRTFVVVPDGFPFSNGDSG